MVYGGDVGVDTKDVSEAFHAKVFREGDVGVDTEDVNEVLRAEVFGRQIVWKCAREAHFLGTWVEGCGFVEYSTC